MAVRLKVKINIKNKTVETSAIANAGYESDEPELMIPEGLAERFNLLEKLPRDAELETYDSVSGRFEAYRIENFVNVEVLTTDKHSESINCSLVIVAHEKEVIISDKLIDELKVDLIQPGRGKWRFIDDPSDKLRKSEPPVYW